VSAYPVGYIEQLARPFRLRNAGKDERAHAQRGRRGEQGASDGVRDARHASELSSAPDTQKARR